jgi:hypothetical protein
LFDAHINQYFFILKLSFHVVLTTPVQEIAKCPCVLLHAPVMEAIAAGAATISALVAEVTVRMMGKRMTMMKCWRVWPWPKDVSSILRGVPSFVMIIRREVLPRGETNAPLRGGGGVHFYQV